jgi:putative transcription factor
MYCEICGSEERLYKTDIEGVVMNVCLKCGEFGKIIGIVKEEVEEKKKNKSVEVEEEPEIIERIVDDFAEKIKKKRGEMGLDQEKFANKLNQKKSVIHKMENGELTPSIDLAKRLEKILDLKLVEEYKEEKVALNQKIDKEEVTIGDFIKIKSKNR